MPIRDFPFICIAAGHPPRPYLPVKIINPTTGQSIRGFGLIDTGADNCAVPAVFADPLGHILPRGISRQIGTGNGFTTAYVHTTTIEIYNLNNQLVHQITNAPVDFMPNLNTILLGVSQFLEGFKLEINYPEQKFSIYM